MVAMIGTKILIGRGGTKKFDDAASSEARRYTIAFFGWSFRVGTPCGAPSLGLRASAAFAAVKPYKRFEHMRIERTTGISLHCKYKLVSVGSAVVGKIV
jgi:hypothetical protein